MKILYILVMVFILNYIELSSQFDNNPLVPGAPLMTLPRTSIGDSTSVGHPSGRQPTVGMSSFEDPYLSAQHFTDYAASVIQPTLTVHNSLTHSAHSGELADVISHRHSVRPETEIELIEVMDRSSTAIHVGPYPYLVSAWKRASDSPIVYKYSRLPEGLYVVIRSQYVKVPTNISYRLLCSLSDSHTLGILFGRYERFLLGLYAIYRGEYRRVTLLPNQHYADPYRAQLMHLEEEKVLFNGREFDYPTGSQNKELSIANFLGKPEPKKLKHATSTDVVPREKKRSKNGHN